MKRLGIDANTIPVPHAVRVAATDGAMVAAEVAWLSASEILETTTRLVAAFATQGLTVTVEIYAL